MAWFRRVGGMLDRTYALKFEKKLDRTYAFMFEKKFRGKYEGTFIAKWGKDISALKLCHSAVSQFSSQDVKSRMIIRAAVTLFF